MNLYIISLLMLLWVYKHVQAIHFDMNSQHFTGLCVFTVRHTPKPYSENIKQMKIKNIICVFF